MMRKGENSSKTMNNTFNSHIIQRKNKGNLLYISVITSKYRQPCDTGKGPTKSHASISIGALL